MKFIRRILVFYEQMNMRRVNFIRYSRAPNRVESRIIIRWRKSEAKNSWDILVTETHTIPTMNAATPGAHETQLRKVSSTPLLLTPKRKPAVMYSLFMCLSVDAMSIKFSCGMRIHIFPIHFATELAPISKFERFMTTAIQLLPSTSSSLHIKLVQRRIWRMMSYI